MGAIEGGGESKSHARGGKKHKKKRRLRIRIDMTPMVDVAFLLLTFFMLTTYFSKPQTMELNLPPDERAQVEVAESNLLTIRVASDGVVFWNTGTDPANRIEMKELRKFLKDKNKENPKLITLLKIDRDGKYEMLVKAMDEVALAKVERFSLAQMNEYDKRQIQKARGS
ncbi:MAG: biopolymer transporter ExbD [Ignavibacteriales bacterium]|nr:biopolymer transporter ExbD [Ignavibacteriales bacterium]